MVGDPADELHPVDEGEQIRVVHVLARPGVLVEVVEVDDRCVPRVGAPETDRAAVVARVPLENGPGEILVLVADVRVADLVARKRERDPEDEQVGLGEVGPRPLEDPQRRRRWSRTGPSPRPAIP